MVNNSAALGGVFIRVTPRKPALRTFTLRSAATPTGILVSSRVGG